VLVQFGCLRFIAYRDKKVVRCLCAFFVRRFIIDTPVSYFQTLSIARKYGIHTAYVNTEGAQDLFMEEEFGARIQRRELSNGYFIITWP
jgi:hypothetical protein